MCQGAVRKLCNPSERCHVRKVARLLAQALSEAAAALRSGSLESPSHILRNSTPVSLVRSEHPPPPRALRAALSACGAMPYVAWQARPPLALEARLVALRRR